MTIQTINIGSAANDGTGDPLRSAFDKTNDNFGELDTRVSAAQADADASVKSVNGNSPDTDGDVTIDAASDWGTIGGTLSAQTDLQSELDAKANASDVVTALSGKADAAATTSALAGKQPLDGDLTAIAALTTTAFGRGVLTAADAAAAKTYLEVTEGGGAWGEITGTLSDQTDLQSELDAKANASDVVTALSGKADAAATTSALAGKQPLDTDLTAIAARTTTSFGLDFLELADASAAFTLLGLGDLAAEDYEVGTFTPTLYGSSVAGSHTYNAQAGFYIKVGDLVWYSIKMSFTAIDGAMSGGLRAGPLPFVTANVTDLTSLATTLYSTVTYSAGRTQAYGSIGQNVDYISLGATGSGVALASLTEASVTSSSFFFLSGMYRAA